MVSYLVMGISSQEEKLGWFNSYNFSVYTENDYDYDKTQQASIEDLKNEIRYQLDNPRETIDFFRKKITSIWCEASFGAFYETRIDYPTVLQNHSHWYNDMFSYTGKMRRVLSLFLEVYQSIVYLGVIFYIIYSWKDYALLKFSGLIIFLGGFIFHIFWEAKSSYTFVYFVLLIPYAIVGLGKCFDKMKIKSVNIETDENAKSAIQILKNVVPLLAGVALLVICSSILLISEDDEEWFLYTAERRYINEGCYYLQSKAADEICKVEENEKWFLSVDTDYVWKYELTDIGKKRWLTVVDGEIHMLSDGEAIDSDIDIDSSKWRFERTGGSYCIRWWLDMNKVVTYDAENGSIFLSDYEEENQNQLWELVQ